MADRQQVPSLDLIFGEVSKQLDLQWQVWEAVDARLRLILGFIGAVFVATLAFSDPTRDLAAFSDIFLVVAITLLLRCWPPWPGFPGSLIGHPTHPGCAIII